MWNILDYVINMCKGCFMLVNSILDKNVSIFLISILKFTKGNEYFDKKVFLHNFVTILYFAQECKRLSVRGFDVSSFSHIS